MTSPYSKRCRLDSSADDRALEAAFTDGLVTSATFGRLESDRRTGGVFPGQQILDDSWTDIDLQEQE